MRLRKARYYTKKDNDMVHCQLCPHHCHIKDGAHGICRVRINRDGELYTINYGELTSLALDPIEKKPLYHFYPGALILSAGTMGCNLSCSFCQNHTIAHGIPDTHRLEPENMVELARKCKPEGALGVAFTYNEPSIWYEYVRDTAELLVGEGMQVVLVTNGYIEESPLDELLPWIGAMNIDVKSFSSDFYRRHCKARLDEVRKRVEQCVGKTHLEITTLIIPGENDAVEEIEKLAKWLASLDRSIPLHLSRYYPAYHFEKPPTPLDTLSLAHDTARQFLDFVYVGNILGEVNNTYCRNCGELLISRHDYNSKIVHLQGNRCSNCGSKAEYVVGL